MSENKHARFLLKVLYVLLIAAGLWLVVTVALPWLLPFLLALLLAAMLERPVRWVIARLRLPRGGAAAVCTLAFFLVLCGALALAVWRLGYELALLLGRLPILLSSLPALSGQVEDWVYKVIVAVPVELQDVLRQALDEVLRQGMALPAKLYDNLLGLVSDLASALPSVGLFLFTTVLATYFSSANRPTLLAFLNRQLPRGQRSLLLSIRRVLRGAFGGWLQAQGILMLVTFGELTVGFLFLRVDLALVLAALVALVDALPVFGIGTVLLPWAVVSLLGGDMATTVGLVVLYAVISLVRSLLEPKVVGNRAGLPPLAGLLAMYLGFQAFGVFGMIFAPLAAILLKQLHDCGVVRLWR